MSDILEYKCPCCGGAIEFNSRLQKMKCPYCDTEFELDTLKQFEEEDKKGKKRRKRKMLKDIKMECFQVIDIVKKLIYNISN